MQWPGQIPAGTTCSELSTTMDLLPTIAKLAGAHLADARIIDGHDIWPLMAGAPDAQSPYEAFYYASSGEFVGNFLWHGWFGPVFAVLLGVLRRLKCGG